jgi:protease II
VARLRAAVASTHSSSNSTPPIILTTSMEGGHFGTGGAGGSARDMAREFAFLHLALGLPLDK